MRKALPRIRRRSALRFIGRRALLLVGTKAARADGVSAGTPGPPLSQTSSFGGPLSERRQGLACVSRRRGFQTVPLVVTSPGLWDHEAAGQNQQKEERYGYQSS
jgi:hypothetical protein